MDVRVVARARGAVQGVGLRPLVLRLARALGLRGHVRNVGGDLEVDVEGDRQKVDLLLAAVAIAPAPAAVASLDPRDAAPLGRATFEIAPSEGDAGRAGIPPDQGPCAACLAEVSGPGDRRCAYPFVSCTACGPRWTIARALPFDRARTSMAPFAPCAACAAEHDDPHDRRLHAQTHACPACGPTLSLLAGGGPIGRGGAPAAPTDGTARLDEATRTGGGAWTGEGARTDLRGRAALDRAVELLRAGGVVAIKGVGGWQVACKAAEAAAVARVRALKRRPEKPLALLCASVGLASAIVELPDGAEAALGDPARPIVLLPRRGDLALVDRDVAPGLPTLGVMLPASPLHALLAEAVGLPLVLTSANDEGEPILIDDAEAARRLGPQVDALLGHDREIVARADDSVAQLHAVEGRGQLRLLRRARGFVPAAIELPVRGPDLVAFGGDLKGAVCVVRAGEAVLSPHLGDLDVPEVARAASQAVDHLTRLLGVRPALAACDGHPDFVSTRLARETGLPLVAVQHHHAHAAAVLAELGRTGPALAAILDGFGLGEQGEAWGCELLEVDLLEARRLGRLRPVALPGGDRAAREPWRSALAHLVAAGVEEDPPALASIDPALRAQLRRVAARGPSPLAGATSSAGRLFDAVAALAGVRLVSAYEAQAALELEGAAGPVAGVEADAYPFPVVEPADDGGLVELDPRPLVRAIVDDVSGATRRAPRDVSRRFHLAFARALAEALAGLADRTGLETVVLAGGCFQNLRLLHHVEELLRAIGLEPLSARLVPSGDGGLALGQAAVASARAVSP